MKERPILFSSAMVNAILDGRKTQTRRVIKPQPVCTGTSDIGMIESHIRWWDKKDKNSDGVYVSEHEVWVPTSPTGKIGIFDPPFYNCPFGQSGDRLWVREKWQSVHFSVDMESGYCDDWYASDSILKEPNDFYHTLYAASEDWEESVEERGFPWRPGVHMPRWACRITLEIVGVRVERLQDINEEDARSEGIIDGGCINCGNHEPCGCDSPQPDARDSFIWLWNSINGKKYPWSSNPWVWVIEFKRIARTTSARPDSVQKKEKALKNRAKLEAASGFEAENAYKVIE